jgi:hypothetical protein
MKAHILAAALATPFVSPSVGQVTFSGPPVDVSREREPVFKIGKDSARQKMIYVWAADCSFSARAFQEIIRPLMTREVARGELQIYMYQYARVQSDLDGSGLVAQCVPASRYQAFTRAWLDTHGRGGEDHQYLIQ